MRDDLSGLKASIALSSLFARDGVTLRDAGNGEKIGCCPIHEDDRPSLYVNDKKGTFFCHGCGSGGDHVSYLAAMHGMPFKDGVAFLRDLAGPSIGDSARPSPAIRHAEPDLPKPIDLPSLVPDLSTGSRRDHWTLAKLRGLSVGAIEAAAEIGLLRFGTWKRQKAWFVTDPHARVAQARRLDGREWQWQTMDHAFSSKTFRLPCDRANKAGSWLVGIEKAAGRRRIEITEGEGDLLAAIDMALRDARFGVTGFACLLGAANRLHPKALPLLSGKDVHLWSQNDKEGAAGAERWREQLLAAGATRVEIWHPPGAGQDLNDHVRALRGWRPVHRSVAAPRREPAPALSLRLCSSPAIEGR